MTNQSALIIGATGATGKKLLNELLSSPHFTRVGEYGRRWVCIPFTLPVTYHGEMEFACCRVTPEDQLGPGKAKLEQKVIDFERLEASGLKDGKWDVVYITYVPLSWPLRKRKRV
jgi:oxidoreductase